MLGLAVVVPLESPSIMVARDAANAPFAQQGDHRLRLVAAVHDVARADDQIDAEAVELLKGLP